MISWNFKTHLSSEDYGTKRPISQYILLAPFFTFGIYSIDPVHAWYLPSSFPAMLYMSYKYGSTGNGEDSFRNGVLANAMRGGENVATGAMLGALLGAECGYSNLPAHFVSGLMKSQQDQMNREIDEFIKVIPFAKNFGSSDL